MTRSLVVLALLTLASLPAVAQDSPPPPIELPTFTWGPWHFEISPDATINRRYISFNALEELEVLTKMAKEDEQRRREKLHVEPDIWRVVYAPCPETDLIYVDKDGTRYRQLAGMGTDEKAWALLSEQQYYDCAYAYSRGNLKIEATDVVMQEPLLGEYGGNTFFWPGDWSDLGTGIDVSKYDSVIGHYFPGPSRPWARGGTGGGHDWCAPLGHTSVQFAEGREVGGPITDMCVITLHEWLHQIAGMKGWKSGYQGTATQYDPGNYHHGAHVFWMRYVLMPAMWRKIHMQIPEWSPPNKPTDRYAGFVPAWLAAGVFDLPKESQTNEATIPARDALDKDALDPAAVLPDRDQPVGSDAAVKWVEVKRPWKSNQTNLREVFASPHRDSYAYAHVYVKSPQPRDAILWISSPEPCAVRLNGKPVMKLWRGVAEDEGTRRVKLMAGWNRLLVKSLDQEAGQWMISARFTDLERKVLEDLEFSSAKPQGPIVATAEAADAPAPEIKYYKWADIEDDWFGLLPVLSEHDLEALFGQPGVRIVNAPAMYNGREMQWQERRWLMVDVSALKGIQSRVIAPTCSRATLENDSLLNNVLDMSREVSGVGRIYESMALVRYTRKDGTPGDLVLVRADMIEPFMELGRYPAGWTGPKHSERIIGFICRDTKTFVCFDTNLGDPLPVNELDMLVVRDPALEIAAGPDVPRVLRGKPCKITYRLTNLTDQTLSGKLVLSASKPAETLGDKAFALPPHAQLGLDFPLETARRPADLLALSGVATYERNGQTVTLAKPVTVPIFDAVGVKVRIEGSEVLTTPEHALLVTVSNNLSEPAKGEVAPALPKEWKVEPKSARFELAGLDQEQVLRFKLKIGDKAPDGPVWLKATAKLDRKDALPAEGSLFVTKRFDPVLVQAGFEDGIDGDLAFTDALYDVQLCRTDPAVGRGCLQISDRGGQRFGHVNAYGRQSFKPAEIVPADTAYYYDTKVYPIVDFWFKMDADSQEDNIGLGIVLDDGESGYGVLINGFWEQQWVPRVMVGQAAGFKADGKWHHIVLNLDEMLDKYLGDTSHHVSELWLGDTRTFSSGWWYDYRHHKHYLDEFQIRRDAPKPALAAGSPFPAYSKDNRVPAFESPVVSGLKATLRFDQLGYFPWDGRTMQVWLTNRSDQSIRIATGNRAQHWDINITTADGKPVTDGWVGPDSGGPPPATQEAAREGRRGRRGGQRGAPDAAQLKVLKPGQSHVESIPVDELFKAWGDAHQTKLQDGQRYIVKVCYSSDAPGADSAAPAWTGEAESNASELTLIAMPTAEQELVTLQQSGRWRQRAKAAAQLGKYKHQAAIAALAQALLNDANDDVRLNAARALGDMGRVDPAKPETATALAPAVDALIKALADKNWRVAEYAGASLGRIGDRRATGALLPRLNDKSKWVRRRTIDALAELGDPAGVSPIGERMSDPSREVRREALNALIRFCDARIGPVNNLSADRRKAQAEQAAAEVIAGLDQKRQAALEEFLAAYRPLAEKAARDEFYVIRQVWIGALPRYQEAQDATDVILGSLGDNNNAVRAAALAALGQLRQRAEERKELDQFRQRTAAVVPKLTELLGDYYQDVREQAVEVFAGVVGKSVEEATGKPADYWRAKIPRPGDPRSPHAEYWKRSGG